MLKKLRSILFPYNLAEVRWDLFRFQRIKSFFYNRKNFAYIRTFGDIVFIFIILYGLFGPQSKEENPVIFLTWGIWWPSVVLSWFFLGRMWCAFCPFPGVARLFQKLKLTLGKEPPLWLKKYGIHLATTFFFVIIWLETATPLAQVPRYTALLILSVVGFAGLFGILYKGYAWCRYLCPLGRITGVSATMALIEFRPDYSVCRGCKGAYCKKSTPNISPCPVYLGAISVQNNLNCFICGHCLLLCPNDSPRVYFRHPLKEIISNKGKGITCSYIVPFLIGSQISRFLVESSSWKAFLSQIYLDEKIAFTLLFLFLSFAILMLSRLTILILGVFEDPIFGRFNLAIASIIPLAFTGELIFRLKYFLQELDEFLNTITNLFKFKFLQALNLQIPNVYILIISYFLLFFAFIATLYIIYYFYSKDFEHEIPFKNFTGLIVFDLCLFFIYFIIIPLSLH